MRSNRIFWGLVVLALGILLLLANIGVISGNIWNYIWPVFLVILGVWFLLGPVLSRGSRETKQVVVPLEGAADAEVTIRHGAGRLEIHSMADNGQLVDGTFAGGVDVSRERVGNTLRLGLSVPNDAFAVGFPFMFNWEGFRWNVGFNRSVPMTLRLDTGAGESTLDLTDLQVKNLALHTGASSTRLIMPAQAVYTRAEIGTGAASLELRIPEGVGASLRIKSGVAGINVDSRRFIRRGDVYETENYSTAPNRMDIQIETGVGSVDVR